MKSIIRTAVATLSLCSLLLPSQVWSAYLAHDLAGQISVVGAPIFTKNTANNVPNARGFDGPHDVAIDTVNHRLFVADEYNKRIVIHTLNASNQLIDRVADGSLGTSSVDVSYTGGSTTQSNLYQPTAIEYDAAHDRLFVYDSQNCRIMVFDTTSITDGENAVNVIGEPNFTTACQDYPNATRRNIGSSTGGGGVAYDATDELLFVSDTAHNRILAWDVNPGTITDGASASYVLGQSDFTSVGGGTTSQKVSGPEKLVYDPVNSRLFVGDVGNKRVLVFDFNLTPLANNNAADFVLGKPNFTTSVSGALTQKDIGFGGFGAPIDMGVSIDDTGDRLFVTDTSAARLMIWDFATYPLATYASAAHVLGATDFTSTVGCQGTYQGGCRFNGTAYDPVSQYLWVAASNDTSGNSVIAYDLTVTTNGENAVEKLGYLDENDEPYWSAMTDSSSSNGNNTPNNEGFNSPRTVTIDTTNHKMYVVDSSNHRVIRYDLDTSDQLVDHFADVVLGQTDFKNRLYAFGGGEYSDHGFANNPESVAVDGTNGWLFIGDGNARRIAVFDTSNLVNYATISYALGQTSLSDSLFGSSQTQFGFGGPKGQAYDPVGNRIFVADSDNNRVLVWDFDEYPLATGASAAYVLGQSNFTNNSTGLSAASLSYPYGVGYDTTEQLLFVSDVTNKRVMIWDLSGGISNGMPASHVLGASDFTTPGSGGPTQSEFEGGEGIAIDPQKHMLFVADENNSRILVFRIQAIRDGMNASAVIGADDFTSAGGGSTNQEDIIPRGLYFDQVNRFLYAVDPYLNRVMGYSFVKITTDTLPNLTVGTAVSESILTQNEQGTVTFELTSGTLPPGLSLGSLTGTPTTPGTYTFTVHASDSNGGIGSFWDDQTYTITVDSPGAVILPPSPTPTPSPGESPMPTPLLEAGIIINDGAATTRSRIVDLDLKSPFSSGEILMRIADGSELTADDRDLLYAVRASASADGRIASPSLANTELQSGILVPYDPVRNGWDLCRGPTSCISGTYHVYAQFVLVSAASASAPASLGDVISTIYEDDILYVSGTPSPTPIPITPTPTPAASPSPSPTPVPAASPSVAPAIPSGSPAPSGTPAPPATQQTTITQVAETASGIIPTLLALAVAAPAIAIATATSLLSFVLQRTLTLIGPKPRRRIWGTVYDAQTKHPIPFAKVQLVDASARVLETRIADRDGRYGFLVAPEGLQTQTISVQIVPVVPGYAFPSTRVTPGATDFIVYERVYTGGPLTLTADQIVNADIPLDPIGDQRPWAALTPRLFRGLTTRSLGVMFWIGLVVIPIAIWMKPSTLNIAVAIVFVLSNMIIMLSDAYRPYGTVTDITSGRPLPFTLITLNDPSGRRVTFTVSNERGRYVMVVQRGTYELVAYTSASIVPQRQTRLTFTTRKGWITRALKL